MANVAKRLTTNAPGNFFVDSTCINCDACRQLAPTVFEEVEEFSVVTHQPKTQEELYQAYQALLACPVGSIGNVQGEPSGLQQAMASFPLRLDGGVFYNGFHSAKSFGGTSYFVRHTGFNWLIDSPRYVGPLVEAFERMGGIRYIFLTHEDDVADAARYAKRFCAIRIVHRADAEAMPEAEWIIDGEDPVPVAPHFQLIPVPGHTPGSLALLY